MAPKLLIELQEMLVRLQRIDLLSKLARAKQQMEAEQLAAGERAHDMGLGKPPGP